MISPTGYYYAAKATADTAEFVGVDQLTLAAHGIEFDLNDGHDLLGEAAVDFVTSFPANGSQPAGLSIPTSGAPVVIDFDGNTQIGVSVDQAILQVSEFLHVSGSFAFVKGPEVSATVDYELGTVEDIALESMTIGATHVQAFVGIGGPYRTDANHDLVWDSSDPINEDAKGFAIDDLNFGMTIMTRAPLELNPVVSNATFIAVKADASQIGLVGFGDDIKLEAHNVALEINTSSGNVGGPIVNFAESFPANGSTPAGMPIRTGTSTPPIYIDSADLHRLRRSTSTSTAKSESRSAPTRRSCR